MLLDIIVRGLFVSQKSAYCGNNHAVIACHKV